jgi:MobC-like protein
MNPEDKNIRKYWLTVRLNDQEHKELDGFYEASTCRQLSDYVRKIILNKPVNIKYRNVSVDDFLKEFLQLKKELNAIGNNFNQAVHKLHTLEKIPEFHHWVMRNEQDKTILFNKIDSILNRLNEIYLIWSRS